MERYEHYKDSGIEWIGEIPVGWKVKRFRYLFNLITDKSDGDFRKVGLENIESESGKFIETNTDFEGDGINFCIDDILFGKLRPYLAKVYLSEFQGKAVGDFFVFRSKGEVYPKFGARVLLSRRFIDIVDGSTFGSKMPRASWEFISNLLVAYPNEDEQINIANYLDYKTAEIDALISQKERLIELYEEEKSAIINQAVTKGIDPDAPLKDSGIEWLGEIPEDWRIVALKRLTSKITDGEHISPNFTASGMPFLSAKDVRDGCVNLPDDKFVDYEDGVHFRKRCNPELNDILLVSRGATVGRVSIVDVDVEFCLLGSVILLKPNEQIRFKYLFYSLKNKLIQDHFLNSSQSSAQQAIYLVNVATTQFAIPKHEEQDAIVDHIETEIARIDDKIKRTQRIIELQKEYRTALISEVVTGKVKVPESYHQEATP